MTLFVIFYRKSYYLGASFLKIRTLIKVFPCFLCNFGLKFSGKVGFLMKKFSGNGILCNLTPHRAPAAPRGRRRDDRRT